MSAVAVSAKTQRKKNSRGKKRGIWAGIVVLAIVGMALGTKVVSADDPIIQGPQKFDAQTYGAEKFPTVQKGIDARAVEAPTLNSAITADPKAAESKYAVPSSGGPVYSTKFTGVVGEGQSGIFKVTVDGMPDDLLIRVQTGPAINGTELRDATGEIQFGQFVNQIEYQNAAAALNDELKTQVLSAVDRSSLTGKTISVVGAFTLVNPNAWLITPVQLDIK